MSQSFFGVSLFRGDSLNKMRSLPGDLLYFKLAALDICVRDPHNHASSAYNKGP